MVRAALQTDQSEIWWVYLLEGIVAIVLGLLLPMAISAAEFSGHGGTRLCAAAD